MLALLGDEGATRRIAAAHDLTVANDNAPGQLVLSGPAGGARRGPPRTRGASGSRRCPWRSGAPSTPRPWRRPCRSFAKALEAIDVRPPRVPVYSSVTAPPVRGRQGRARRRAGAARALARDARTRCATAASSDSSRSGPARSSRASSAARSRDARRACSASRRWLMPELANRPVPAPAAARDGALRGAGIASVAMCVPDRAVANAEIAERTRRRRELDREAHRDRGAAHRLAGGAAERLRCRGGRDGAGAGGAHRERARPGPRRDDVARRASRRTRRRWSPTELGATRAGAIDVGAACTGFLSALSLATAQIESRRAENVLVVGADLLSRITDPSDRSTAGLLADGAGAALIRAVDAPGRIGPVVLGSDGAASALITASHSERRAPHERPRHLQARGRPHVAGDARGRWRSPIERSTRSTSSSTTRPTAASSAPWAWSSGCRPSGRPTTCRPTATPRRPRCRWP